MRYFDYQQKGALGKVWSLFTGLSSISTEEKLYKSKYHCDYSHTLEIVNAALNGTISTSDEDFNLEAYENVCKKNDKIAKTKSYETVLYIVDKIDDEKERENFGDVSSNKLKIKEDPYEDSENVINFSSSLSALLNLRGKYMKTTGVDIVKTLKGSLLGIPESTKLINRLIKKDSVLNEIVVSLCESGQKCNLIDRLEELV